MISSGLLVNYLLAEHAFPSRPSQTLGANSQRRMRYGLFPVILVIHFGDIAPAQPVYGVEPMIPAAMISFFCRKTP